MVAVLLLLRVDTVELWWQSKIAWSFFSFRHATNVESHSVIIDERPQRPRLDEKWSCPRLCPIHECNNHGNKHGGLHPSNHHHQRQQHTSKKKKKNQQDIPENCSSSTASRFHVWNYDKKRPPTHAHPERDLEEDDDKPHSVDSRIVSSTASYLTSCLTAAFTIGYGVGTWPHHLPTSSSRRTSRSSTDRGRGDETDAETGSLSWSFSSENPPISHSSHVSTKTTLLSRSQVVRQLPPCEFVQFQCWSCLQAPTGAATQVAVVRAVTLALSSWVRSITAMGGKRRGNRHSNKYYNHKTDTRTNHDPPLGWSWLFQTFGVEQLHVQALDRALSSNLRNIVLDRLQQTGTTAQNKKALMRILHELPEKPQGKDSTDLAWSFPEYYSSRNRRMVVNQTEPNQQLQRHPKRWWWNKNPHHNKMWWHGKKDKTSLDHSPSFSFSNNDPK